MVKEPSRVSLRISEELYAVAALRGCVYGLWYVYISFQFVVVLDLFAWELVI